MKTIVRQSRLVGLVISLALWGCSDKPAVQPAAAPASAPAAAAAPPVTVGLVTAQQRDLPVTFKATGTVTALSSVDVRAQVTSTVRQVHFKEGQFVKAGQLLFSLDSRTDEANLAKARAQWAKDNASLADARRQLTRARELLAQNFVSQGAVDTAQTQVDALTAALAVDQAAIDAAKVALSFDQILAPQSGRVGAVTVFPGSAVQANQTSLVNITQLDPVGVAFSIPQRLLPDALGALKDGGAAVTATLADGGGSFEGRLKFVDNGVDANSGTVKAKAVFDNAQSRLWPGAFVEVSQTLSTLKGAVVVPQAAIVQNARGSIVYTVADGKASLRPIKVVFAAGGDAAVTGIQAGEKLVLDGKQNVRPDSRVVERTEPPKGAASAAAKAEAAKP